MDALKNILNQIKEQTQKLSVKTRKLLLILLCVVVALSVVIAVILNNQPYQTLFSGLTSAEASEIGAKLTELGVTDYKIEDNGATVLVPKDQEMQLKAQLVMEGYPKSGRTYDIFLSNSGLTTTDSDKNHYKLLDLQNWMSGTIRWFPGVKDAAVTITPADEQRYVLEEDRVEAKASVVVTMQNGGSPSTAQVNGIQRLVAGGVPGLTPANVTVLDGNGQDVSGGGDATTQLGITQFKLQLEREIENDNETKVRKMLAPFFGEEDIQVSVAATVNVDKTIRETITYLPSQDNTGVVDSASRSTEIVRDGTAAGGVAGTETNAEVPVYPNMETDGTEAVFATDESIDYAVSQVKEQVQSDSGMLTDMSIAISVSGGEESEARTAALRNLVATTAGIAPELADTKVTILYNMGTAADPGGVTPEVPVELIFGFTLEELILMGAGVLVFLIIIVMILTMIGKGKKSRRAEQALMDAPFAAPAEPADYGLDLKNIPNTRQGELRDQISTFTDDNPEISAQLIRTWLRGVEED